LDEDLAGLFAWGTTLTGAYTEDISNIVGNLNGTYANCSFHNSMFNSIILWYDIAR